MVPFTKGSACGNDFLIIDGSHVPDVSNDLNEFSRRICDRHNGIGADGVEWLFRAHDADIHARLINADGSEAEISGNGTRCVAAYLASQGRGEKLRVQTGAGIKICEMISRNGHQFEFEMDMGKPKVGEEFSIQLTQAEVRGTPVSLGNPHYVLFVNEFPPEWQSVAVQIQRQPQFTYGINVEFVRVIGPGEIEVRFYERGVGETQSSGTGSCASAVASIAAGRAGSPLQVHAPGGTQVVRWDMGNIYLRGPAQLIGEGTFYE